MCAVLKKAIIGDADVVFSAYSAVNSMSENEVPLRDYDPSSRGTLKSNKDFEYFTGSAFKSASEPMELLRGVD